ncbi:hypothetical protein [Halorubrum ezzemoulense]|uniref:hypothetical protein n=1 Tax=Halorubrum ezzemoulense TaxID=337243 RepID=UPI002330D621|nr:hypothetical protein [Halorubrum ezzemoulense]MDB9252628.1 hypothetical protein [Halorubrum ezzemoulense]MDB9255262.1 hypothetical protein [Halorubrum ezzemoulense]MDB9275973.1 hypothetical protein [Halorubrum ezzemoulense]
MPTRRQTTIGLLSAAVGSAAVTSGSFLSGTAAAADLRVVVVSELTLTPGRTGDEYVRADDDGEVTEIVIQKLNQRAISRFEDLIEVTNNGDVPYDRLEFSFSATDEDPDASKVADTLRVVSGDDVSTERAQGETTLLADTGETFDSGDAVTFGIVVDLIADSSSGLEELPDSANVTLEIAAIDKE